MTDDVDRWRDPDEWPYHFELLRVDWLFVDDRYQRPVTRIADQIAVSFDRTLFEPLLVSKRGKDRYAIADGQNRWEGYKRIGGRWLYCRVMRLTPQEEAEKFSKLQKGRKGITPLETFKADVFAGDDEAVAVDALLTRHGIHTSDVSGAYGAEDALSAITAVRRNWQRYGDARLDVILETIKAAFPGQRGRYSGELINALAIFLERTPDLHRPRLIVALAEQVGSVAELKARSAAKRRATGKGMGGGSAVYTVKVIDEAYGAAGRSPFRHQWEDIPA